jgi:hypothetical protein
VAHLDHPELILNKDGSLLATYEFCGVDADSADASDITSARDQLDQAAARSTIASPHGGASHTGAPRAMSTANSAMARTPVSTP